MAGHTDPTRHVDQELEVDRLSDALAEESERALTPTRSRQWYAPRSPAGQERLSRTSFLSLSNGHFGSASATRASRNRGPPHCQGPGCRARRLGGGAGEDNPVHVAMPL
jgi:hypothetical protein